MNRNEFGLKKENARGEEVDKDLEKWVMAR